ncbi:MAG: tripartite tricarboxylate transporter substrate binding protein [Rhodoplanes sp.]|uniref:Bug family tripartite tricarboxylate transporter substrate binding protein n=1 Tax=Rhodoplanes sp. TaxID=1968906 RepID=UPI001851AB56|nr:tripartite tricarboxylate transporter substrate binding protein [Rhodoplanes sp.]NVO13254.1 tripartite tricarboxylate transporter substrate binding protein [Rhodoplanes sp.]
MNRRQAIGLLLGTASAAGFGHVSGAVAAEDPSKYPTQPVRVIVPFAPGGASDFAMRLLQAPMSQALGQQVIIENRTGAAGNVGMDVAGRGAPDGYTVFFGNVGTVSINPTLYPDMSVKPDKAFIPVSNASETPSALICSMKFPPNNVKELIEYVKARPGKVNFASPGSGSVDRLEMELFRKATGLDMNHVPYKGGAGPAVADILGGHVELMFVTLAAAMPHVKANRIKILALSSKERSPILPDVPSVAELGYPELVATSWQGFLVPTGTPRPIVDKLFQAIVKAASDPTVKQRLIDGGSTASASESPEAYKAFIEKETARWTVVVKESGAVPD